MKDVPVPQPANVPDDHVKRMARRLNVQHGEPPSLARVDIVVEHEIDHRLDMRRDKLLKARVVVALRNAHHRVAGAHAVHDEARAASDRRAVRNRHHVLDELGPGRIISRRREIALRVEDELLGPRLNEVEHRFRR
jgi:hypothetical protein